MYRSISLIGIFAFVLIAFLFSENKKAFPWRTVLIGIFLQVTLGLIFLNLGILKDALLQLNSIVLAIDTASKAGSSFMFGYLGGGDLPFELKNGGNSFVIAFQVLPIVIVMSALSSLLFHWGILQKVIIFLSKILQKSLGLKADVAVGVAASVFLGIIEAPILIKEYLKRMDRSSLFTVLTACMATVAGTVMVLYANIVSGSIPGSLGHIMVASLLSAPAAVLLSQIMIPPTAIHTAYEYDLKPETKSSFEALINGAMEGVHMCLAICGVIIVLFAFVSLFNQFLALFPGVLTLESIMGFIFYPLTFLMGVDAKDIMEVSKLMGIKTILNEFASYLEFSKLPEGSLSERSSLISLYAMCGFANLGSLGILIGALGTIMPNKKELISRLGAKALVSGTLSTMMTGAVVGLIS